jgi:hypothetical protein
MAHQGRIEFLRNRESKIQALAAPVAAIQVDDDGLVAHGGAFPCCLRKDQASRDK